MQYYWETWPFSWYAPLSPLNDVPWKVQFQKKPIPTPWKVTGNSYKEGGLKLEFPQGDGGAKQKTFCGGGGGGEYGYFLELHIKGSHFFLK